MFRYLEFLITIIIIIIETINMIAHLWIFHDYIMGNFRWFFVFGIVYVAGAPNWRYHEREKNEMVLVPFYSNQCCFLPCFWRTSTFTCKIHRVYMYAGYSIFFFTTYTTIFFVGLSFEPPSLATKWVLRTILTVIHTHTANRLNNIICIFFSFFFFCLLSSCQFSLDTVD